MSDVDLKRLARIGAAARLMELERERAELRRLFPGLRAETTGSDASEDAPAPRRRRRGMSTANRRAVSLRMKRYWAARRKANGEPSSRTQSKK